MPWAARSLSVFVAAFNEVQNLQPTVDVVVQALRGQVNDYEIIIVNDGSTDGTREVADQLATHFPAVKVVHNPRNMGLGYGWMRATEAATKDAFIFIPGDNTWPYPSLRDLFGSMGRAEVVTTYTTNPEIRSLPRRLLSTTYTAGLNLLFGLNMRYYNGITVYPTAWLRANMVTTTGFGSMAESLLKAIHHGHSVVEVPCAIEERATGRSTAVSLGGVWGVVGTIGRLWVDMRLRARKGPHSTLGLRGAGRGPGRSGRTPTLATHLSPPPATNGAVPSPARTAE